MVAALGAFAAYRYIKAGGLSTVDIDSGSNAQVKKLQQKITLLQNRINELERRHSASRPKEAAEVTKPARAESQLPAKLEAEIAQTPNAQVSKAPAPKQLVAASLPPPTPLPPSSPINGARPDPNLNALKGDLASSQQNWEATANRLGNVVGELDAQRDLVKKNQTDVNELLQITRRTGVPFSLKKGSKFHRVGPISMRLANTDVSNQRYTLRLIVDDKSVQLKDRALNEVIQFYTARSQFPVELVVSQIRKGRVQGMLAVPRDLRAEDQRNGMQPR